MRFYSIEIIKWALIEFVSKDTLLNDLSLLGVSYDDFINIKENPVVLELSHHVFNGDFEPVKRGLSWGVIGDFKHSEELTREIWENCLL